MFLCSMKGLFYFLLFTCFQVTAQTDTITVYFEIGSFEAILLELKKLDVNKKYWKKIDIISYTDYLGSSELNNKLSIERSREIRSRLVQRGLDTEVLGNVEGRGAIGETLESNEGIQESRRTDVVIWTTNKDTPEDKIIEVVEDRSPKIIKKVELKSQIESADIGDHLVLKDMIFIPGQHFLTEESAPSYDELFQLLKKNPNLRIKIEGHICCKIDDEDGLDLATNKFNLSEARAKYVYDSLIEDGISEDRLSFEGFARNNPIFPDEINEEEKMGNRRVEIRIIEK